MRTGTAATVIIILSIIALFAFAYSYGIIDLSKESEEDKFVGKWKVVEKGEGATFFWEGVTITFFSDGTCHSSAFFTESSDWDVMDERLRFLDENGNPYLIWPYNFSDDGETLVVNDEGTTVTFKRM